MPRDFAVLADDDEDRGNDKDTEDMLRDDLTDGGESRHPCITYIFY